MKFELGRCLLHERLLESRKRLKMDILKQAALIMGRK